MSASRYVRPTISAPPAIPPLLQPQPPIAPLVPPVHVVDLMTEEGSGVFGAVWRGLEAKIVECPALSDSRPEFKTTYDVEPHAELLVLTIRPGKSSRRPISAAGAAAAWCRSSGSARH
jgi:hypothetical protein